MDTKINKTQGGSNPVASNNQPANQLGNTAALTPLIPPAEDKHPKQTDIHVIGSLIDKEGGIIGSPAAKAESGLAATGASVEMEMPKEVKEAGVEKVSESVDLPPDVKKMGVTHSGAASVTVSGAQAAALQVVLPITDQQVVTGLRENDVTNAFHWLAVWCVKKLQKAHVALKIIRGKIVRVKV